MKFDVIVGNPPYRVFNEKTDIHLNVIKTIIPYSTDKLCFIMPSKPIYVQQPYKYYKVFRDGVCVNVECESKDVFKNTIMENTAIFYFNRKAPKSDFCYKFNVNEVFYSIYFSLLPNLNYNIIDNEKDVLLNCQISEEDADEILKFTNNFDFKLLRNDLIRNEIKLT